MTSCSYFIYIHIKYILIHYISLMMKEKIHHNHHLFCHLSNQQYEMYLPMPTDVSKWEQQDLTFVKGFISITSGSSSQILLSNTNQSQYNQAHIITHNPKINDNKTQTLLAIIQPENTHIMHQSILSTITQTFSHENLYSSNNLEGTMQKQVKKPIKNYRANDDNNAHKKIITYINYILKTEYSTLNKEIKKRNKKSVSKKGSRYAFIMKLMDIYKYGGEDILREIMKKFQQIIKEKFDLPEERLSSAENYLKKISKHYKQSMEVFVQERDIAKSLNLIYEIEGFRQTMHRDNGIQHVKNYRKLLQL